MAELSNTFVREQLQEQFGNGILLADESFGMLGITIHPSILLELVSWLGNHEDIQVKFLTDICGSHYPDNTGAELCAVYHMQSMVKNFRIRIKCFLPIQEPNISSLTSLYASANWMERETYDFYGIVFTGHPNLKRILNVEEMDYFPLRKEYPLEDGTRTDKTDEYFGR